MKKTLSLLLCVLSSSSYAAEINIDNIIKSGVSPWLRENKNACVTDGLRLCRASDTSCFSRVMIRCSQQFPLNPSLSNITTTPGNVYISQVVNSPIPVTVKSRVFEYKNCSSTPVKTISSEEIIMEDGLSITTSDSVKTSIGADVKFTVGIFQIGLSGTREVSFAKAQTTTEKTTVKRSLTIEKEVAPYTSLLVKQEVRELNSWFDFSGDLYFDALIENKWYYKSIVPNNLVSVKGQIFNVKSELGLLSYQEVPLDRNTCALPAVARASTKLLATKNLVGTEVDSGYSLKRPMSQLPKRVVVPYSSGMSVNTDDVIANIQLKVVANGNEYCRVSFYSSTGEKLDVVAKPKEYSTWATIITHAGKANTTLSHDSSCKNGFSAEVGYYK